MARRMAHKKKLPKKRHRYLAVKFWITWKNFLSHKNTYYNSIHCADCFTLPWLLLLVQNF